jgi:uncharacterized protein (DUF433 family)
MRPRARFKDFPDPSSYEEFQMTQKALQRVEMGCYIVVDPRICHGEPTFKGTRKLVRDCIELAASGLTIDELAERSNNNEGMCLASKTRQAIAARVSASMASRKTRQRRRRGTLACRLCEPHRLIERPTTG